MDVHACVRERETGCQSSKPTLCIIFYYLCLFTLLVAIKTCIKKREKAHSVETKGLDRVGYVGGSC